MLKKSLGLPETATDAEVAAALEKRATDDAALKAQVADLSKRATLDDESRAFHAELEKSDKAKAQAFLDKDEAGRKAEVALAKSGDETATLQGGVVISKRAVGETAFAVMKAQDAMLLKMAGDITKAQEAAALATFEKRAATDFSHIAGTVSDRASVLKHLSTAPDDVQKAAEAILKAADAAAKLAFGKVGAGGGKAPESVDAEAGLKKMADEFAKADPKLSAAQAYDKALSTPEGAELYEKSLDTTAN